MEVNVKAITHTSKGTDCLMLVGESIIDSLFLLIYLIHIRNGALAGLGQGSGNVRPIHHLALVPGGVHCIGQATWPDVVIGYRQAPQVFVIHHRPGVLPGGVVHDPTDLRAVGQESLGEESN